MGGLVKSIGALEEGNAINAQKTYEANILDRNAELSLATAKEHEDRFRRSARKKVGSLVSSVGANGITLSGSALDVMYDNAIEDELEAQTIKFNGEQKASNLRSEAVLARRAGRNAKRAGETKAVSSLLDTATSLAAGG